MKMIAATLVSMFVVSSVFANVPGGVVDHTLNCGMATNDGGQAVVGISYSLTCQTQALAPQYSLQGCDLYSQFVYPGAQAEKIELALKKQTVANAKLESTDGNIQVRVHKSDLSAVVIFSNGVEMECSK